MFVTSQQQDGRYPKAFAARRWIYNKVLGEPLRVAYVMGDTDAPQHDAVAAVFGSDCKYDPLMCYYHLIAKVIDRLEGLPYQLRNSVHRDTYDLHYSRSADGFTTDCESTETRWLKNPILTAFHGYFKRVWLNDRFSPMAMLSHSYRFATTTNPVEQFNRVLKRDYTAHCQLKMGELLQRLVACCRQRSIDLRPFAFSPVASTALLARVKALRSQRLLREYVAPRISLDFLMMDSCTGVLHVLYTAPKRAYNPATNSMQEALQVSAQVGVNTAREEAENQSKTGWPFDLVAQTCPCSYHFKYGDCVLELTVTVRRCLPIIEHPRANALLSALPLVCLMQQTAHRLLVTLYSGNNSISWSWMNNG
ncbi:hypothetical protein PC129_g3862 [Phytophthora cactorum]|uniref:MULE transposase domain-containing protein n=1 Tax=Phytophthora cactorum TaxID=29920 RepID=A0A329SAS4_9STRA|nr:hypothetical protein Pcac1_g23820 [Phytophthora cactorum]KAG2823325.1 hypothetical protein PC111_g10272 [Phytophthora cactorum]KAG2848420.1 hypothetical protein PC112_g687 [Phytophthora cactorum]KAG2926747.1 hypothetical protein PC114_g3716 [Phytophthora cactorum]KAG2939992.1 hypothetical protein PC115_g2813 [Phytophthora cactorum]